MRPRTAILIGVFLLLVGAGIATPTVAGVVVRRYLEREVLPKLATRLGRKVEVGTVTGGLGQVVVKNIVLYDPPEFGGQPAIRLAQVEVGYKTRPLLKRRVEIDRIIADGLEVKAQGRGKKDNLTPIWRALSTRRSGASGVVKLL